jgi:hypothetical protein
MSIDTPQRSPQADGAAQSLDRAEPIQLREFAPIERAGVRHNDPLSRYVPCRQSADRSTTPATQLQTLIAAIMNPQVTRGASPARRGTQDEQNVMDNRTHRPVGSA